MNIGKLMAWSYLGLLVGTAVAEPVLSGVDHIIQKAKITKGLKDGTIVEENGKYYEKFTVEDGPNYRRRKLVVEKRQVTIVDI